MPTKKSITPNRLDQYKNLTLREIETIANNFRNAPNTDANQLSYRIARQALSNHQRELKSRVFEFELTNNHHLLFYDSTAGFSKMIGNSVLFFAMTIAERIHWRYTIKTDSDHYSISEDGTISFRSLDRISELLANINIYPDPKPSTKELHFFTLPKVYTDEQIASLRDNSKQELNHINNIVMPRSPIPSLYDAICQVSHLIYYQFKHLADSFARDSIGKELVQNSFALTKQYLAFADAKNPDNLKYLLQIIHLAREIRYGLAYASRLRLLHHRDICKVLDQLVIVERIATSAYRKAAA